MGKAIRPGEGFWPPPGLCLQDVNTSSLKSGTLCKAVSSYEGGLSLNHWALLEAELAQEIRGERLAHVFRVLDWSRPSAL